MLRILQVGNSLPYSWPVDPNATFLPGNIAQLTIYGSSQIIATVSNGNAPIGIIDDMKTKAFTAVSWDESVIVPATGVLSGGQYITEEEIRVELENPNIIPGSFVSLNVDVQLIPRNGVLVFPVGTVLNLDNGGTGTPNSIKTIVRYTYQIPEVMGEDSTAGSQRVTVWFQRGIYQTDVFDTAATYPLNCNLFVNDKGQLTSKQLTENTPCIAICTAPPTSQWPWIEFLLL